MKSFGSKNKKISWDKNGENVPHLKTNVIELIHCDIVNNKYQQNSVSACSYSK